jgi:histone H3/H4
VLGIIATMYVIIGCVVLQVRSLEEQDTDEKLILDKPFKRLVKQLLQETVSTRGYPRGTSFRITPEGLQALKEMTEAYVVSLFECSRWVTAIAKRKTMFPEDLYVARRLSGKL